MRYISSTSTTSPVDLEIPDDVPIWELDLIEVFIKMAFASVRAIFNKRISDGEIVTTDIPEAYWL